MQRDWLYFQGELTLFEMASVTALNSIYYNSPYILILGISYFFLVQFLHYLVSSTDQSNFSTSEEIAPQVSLFLLISSFQQVWLHLNNLTKIHVMCLKQ